MLLEEPPAGYGCADVLLATVTVNSTGDEELPYMPACVSAELTPALIISCPPTLRSLANHPRLVKLDAVTLELSVLPVSVPAAAVTVIFPVPSKLVPLIVLPVSKAVAVAALPVVS